MRLRRFSAASAVLYLMFAAAQADAQRSRPAPRIAPSPSTETIDLEIVDADAATPRATVAEPPRGAMFGAVPLSDRAELGLGRFAVGEIARPRSHLEAERHPTDLRRGGRGITGLGLSVRF